MEAMVTPRQHLQLLPVVELAQADATLCLLRRAARTRWRGLVEYDGQLLDCVGVEALWQRRRGVDGVEGGGEEAVAAAEPAAADEERGEDEEDGEEGDDEEEFPAVEAEAGVVELRV